MRFWREASFHERSVWVSLGAIALVDTAYFIAVFRRGSDLDATNLLAILGFIVLALLVVEIGFHAAQRFFGASSTVDERDDVISAQAHRLAYIVLLFGVDAALAILLLRAADPCFSSPDYSCMAQQLGSWGSMVTSFLQTPHLDVHLFIGALVSAELIRFGAQLWLYRAGV